MAPISGPTHKPQAARLIVGLSGASGVIFGVARENDLRPLFEIVDDELVVGFEGGEVNPRHGLSDHVLVDCIVVNRSG